MAEPFLIVVDPPTGGVAPGEVLELTATVTNLQSIVDSASLQALGLLGPHTRIEPSIVRLLPSTAQQVTIHITPALGVGLPAGGVPFAILGRSEVDAGESSVGEVLVELAGAAMVEAGLAPTTSSGRRKAKHRIDLLNQGNAPVDVSLAASDPDELLEIDVIPNQIRLEPGAAASARLSLKAGARDGSNPRIPFVVHVAPTGQTPQTLNGAFRQTGGMPRWLVPAALALVVLGAALFALRPKSGPETALDIGAADTTTIPGAVADPAATTVPGAGAGATTAAPAGQPGKPGPAATTTTKPGPGQAVTLTTAPRAPVTTAAASAVVPTTASQTTFYSNTSAPAATSPAIGPNQAFLQPVSSCRDLASLTVGPGEGGITSTSSSAPSNATLARLGLNGVITKVPSTVVVSGSGAQATARFTPTAATRVASGERLGVAFQGTGGSITVPVDASRGAGAVYTGNEPQGPNGNLIGTMSGRAC